MSSLKTNTTDIRVTNARGKGHETSLKLSIGQNAPVNNETPLLNYMRINGTGSRDITDVLVLEALTSENPLQKINAINDLNDQNGLARIAIESKDQFVRGSAIIKLNAEKIGVVRQLSKEKSDPEIMGIASRRLEVLENEIKKAKAHTQIKLKTINPTAATPKAENVIGQEVTAKKRTIGVIERLRYALIRVNGVQNMEDKEGLKRLAEHHWRAKIREAAAEKLKVLEKAVKHVSSQAQKALIESSFKANKKHLRMA